MAEELHWVSAPATSGAIATNDVQGAYFSVALTETIGNIWMLDATKE